MMSVVAVVSRLSDQHDMAVVEIPQHFNTGRPPPDG